MIVCRWPWSKRSPERHGCTQRYGGRCWPLAGSPDARSGGGQRPRYALRGLRGALGSHGAAVAGPARGVAGPPEGAALRRRPACQGFQFKVMRPLRRSLRWPPGALALGPGRRGRRGGALCSHPWPGSAMLGSGWWMQSWWARLRLALRGVSLAQQRACTRRVGAACRWPAGGALCPHCGLAPARWARIRAARGVDPRGLPEGLAEIGVLRLGRAHSAGGGLPGRAPRAGPGGIVVRSVLDRRVGGPPGGRRALWAVVWWTCGAWAGRTGRCPSEQTRRSPAQSWLPSSGRRRQPSGSRWSRVAFPGVHGFGCGGVRPPPAGTAWGPLAPHRAPGCRRGAAVGPQPSAGPRRAGRVAADGLVGQLSWPTWPRRVWLARSARRSGRSSGGARFSRPRGAPTRCSPFADIERVAVAANRSGLSTIFVPRRRPGRGARSGA